MGDKVEMIDLIGYKIEAYDLDGFINSLNGDSKKYVLLIFNPVSGYKTLSNIPFSRNFTGNFLAANKNLVKIKILYYVLYLPLFFIDLINQLIILSYLIILYKPKNIYVDNSYVAPSFFLIKIFKIKINIIYASQDWLGDIAKKNTLNNLFKYGFSRFFIICDFFGANYCNILLNHTLNLQNARNKFWGRRLNLNEKIYNPDFAIENRLEDSIIAEKNEILFLGNSNESSSIREILKSIEGSKYILTIIGPINDYLISIKKSNKNNNQLKIVGIVSRESFIKFSSNCFLGVNIINDNNIHSKYAIQSKTIDYIKLGLPVLLTQNLGVTSDFIKKYNVGLLLRDAKTINIRYLIDEIHNNRIYTENISKIIHTYQYNKISEYLV